MNRAQRMADITALINGIIDFADVVRQLLLQTLHAGGRGGGNDNLKVGQARLERANKLRANVDFAHTHRMHPDRVPISDGLLELGVVSAETLAKTPLPIAAAQHAREIIWRGQQEEDREQDVVKKTHS